MSSETKSSSGGSQAAQYIKELKSQNIYSMNVNLVKNRFKRKQLYERQKKLKRKVKQKIRDERKKERKVLGNAAPPVNKGRSRDALREFDESVVDPNDEEVKNDIEMDEFESYYKDGKHPKLCITTRVKPSTRLLKFIKEILYVFPNSYYYARNNFPLKQLVDECVENDFTDLLIFNYAQGQGINGLTIIHLPYGPSAHFRLRNVKLNSELERPAKLELLARPEVILNRFTTRLGQRVARMIAALFHQDPEFQGRRVMTFHNQRDFIFFRHHNYIFERVEDGGETIYGPNNKIDIKGSLRMRGQSVKGRFKRLKRDERDIKETKAYQGERIINNNRILARIQEVGPQFTMRLEWLRLGVHDNRTAAEYEWKENADIRKKKRKFNL